VATRDEALVILKDRSVRLYAQQNCVVLPDADGKQSEPKTTFADAITEYLTTGKERILGVAKEAFTSLGANARLDGIAGPGTL
jgi:hypothetical protein